MNIKTAILFLFLIGVFTKPLFAQQEVGQGEILLVPISKNLDSLGLEKNDVRVVFDGVRMSLIKQDDEVYVLLAAGLKKPVGSYSLRIFHDSLIVFSLEVSVRAGNFEEVLQNRPYIPA